MDIEELDDVLSRRVRGLEITQYRVSEAMVVVRADKYARAGDVQKLIKKCQQYGFEKFALRSEGTSDPRWTNLRG